jgi:hypothetical protein
MNPKLIQKLEMVNANLINGITFLVGVLIIISGIIYNNFDGGNNIIYIIMLSIGSSIIASSIVVFLSTKYIVKYSTVKEIIDKWGLYGIYKTRADMNISANQCLDNIERELNLIAMGVRGLRDAKGDIIKSKIKNGIILKILTMNPNSDFVIQKEKEEDRAPGEIKKSIFALIEWVSELKNISPSSDNVKIKFYDSIPQDSFMRIDDKIFIGPNLYKVISQQTISYEFRNKLLGFNYYTNYFNRLWNDPSFAKNEY